MTFVKTALFHKAGEGSGGGGGGGGDQHNLGWYATESALTTAHPTASNGDWAIVGATDTVWVWDSDTTAWKDTGQAGIELPDQTGHSGEFLTTDGTDASWGTTIKPITITPASLYYTGVVTLKGYNNNNDILYMNMAPNAGRFEIDVRNNTGTRTGWYYFDSAFYPNAIMTTSTLGKSTNVWANVFTAKINNGADITVPAVAGSMAVQVSTVPTADSTLEGQIYQFVGATDSTYTNGHFYKCVSDGQSPATYSWEEVSMGGGSSYTAGTGIDITGGVISVTNPTLQNNINSSSQLILLSSKTTVGSQSILIGAYSYNVNGDNTVAIGDHCGANGDHAVAIGASAMGEKNATVSIGAFSNTNFGTVTQGTASTAVGAQTKTDGDYSIALGYNAQSTATNAIQIGSDGVTATTNSDANTFKVGNANGNFEMMSADGTIPTARLTKVNSTITLTAADWSSNTQTITVSGVTSSSIVWVSPDPTDQSAYVSAGILCTAQGTDSLTFTATTTPSADIDVVVVAM